MCAQENQSILGGRVDVRNPRQLQWRCGGRDRGSCSSINVHSSLGDTSPLLPLEAGGLVSGIVLSLAVGATVAHTAASRAGVVVVDRRAPLAPRVGTPARHDDGSRVREVGEPIECTPCRLQSEGGISARERRLVVSTRLLELPQLRRNTSPASAPSPALGEPPGVLQGGTERIEPLFGRHLYKRSWPWLSQ